MNHFWDCLTYLLRTTILSSAVGRGFLGCVTSHQPDPASYSGWALRAPKKGGLMCSRETLWHFMNLQCDPRKKFPGNRSIAGAMDQFVLWQSNKPWVRKPVPPCCIFLDRHAGDFKSNQRLVCCSDGVMASPNSILCETRCRAIVRHTPTSTWRSAFLSCALFKVLGENLERAVAVYKESCAAGVAEWSVNRLWETESTR